MLVAGVTATLTMPALVLAVRIPSPADTTVPKKSRVWRLSKRYGPITPNPMSVCPTSSPMRKENRTGELKPTPGNFNISALTKNCPSSRTINLVMPPDAPSYLKPRSLDSRTKDAAGMVWVNPSNLTVIASFGILIPLLKPPVLKVPSTKNSSLGDPPSSPTSAL